MPVLKNGKWERFALELAKGATATDAYETAGYSRNDGNASTLAKRPEVVERVKELKGAAADIAVVTIAQVVDEIAKTAFANMTDFMTIGPDGQPFLDFSKMTRAQAAAIGELVVETRPDPLGEIEQAIEEGEERQAHGGSLKRRKRQSDPDGVKLPEILKVRFKLNDKLKALDLLGRHLGMFKQTHEHDVADPLKKLLEQLSGTAFRPVDGGK